MAKKREAEPVSQPATGDDTEATTPQVEPEIEAETPAWLTVETLLYGVILILGLALRLWNLGAYPLADSEAIPSLLALRLYGGEQLDTIAGYSPLLVSLNTFIFFLIHESDASARLVTVLSGSGLILLPATFRRRLGPLVCLAASALLAISPTAIFLSRTLNSEIAVALGSLMMVSGFFNWTDNGRQRWLYLLAGGLAILLTSGPLAYSILIVFALIVLFRLANFKDLWIRGLQLSTEILARQTANKSDSDDESNEASRKGLHPGLKRAGIFLLVVVILLSTAATLNLSGFGVATSLFAEWVGRLGFQTGADTGFNAVFLLTIYEPLLIMAGLVGLVYAIFSRNLLHLVFVGWFIGALLLDIIMGGRPNGSVILTVVPLAFLAAFALADLINNLQERGSWSNEGIILVSGLVIIGFGYIGLTGWTARDCAADDTLCQFAWLQTIAALALFLVIVAFFGYLNGVGVAVRGLAATIVVIGLISTINIGWRLNYGPLMNLGYQPLAGIPVSTELVALSDTLASESMIRVGDKTLLDVALVGTSPALQWQLRDYDNQTRVNSINEAPSVAAIITPTPAEEQEIRVGDGAYIGQDFAVNAVWSPVGLQPKELIQWLIYRETGQRPDSDRVVLWLRLSTE